MTNTPARQSAGQSMAYWIGDEEVNGIIIGGMTQTYRFWHKGGNCAGIRHRRGRSRAGDNSRVMPRRSHGFRKRIRWNMPKVRK